jgi:hypothetical protein
LFSTANFFNKKQLRGTFFNELIFYGNDSYYYKQIKTTELAEMSQYECKLQQIDDVVLYYGCGFQFIAVWVIYRNLAFARRGF